MDVLVSVVDQRLKISANHKRYVAGSRNFVRFIFNLPDEWSSLTVFAQFRQGNRAYNRYLDNENAIFLPTEIVEGSCTLILYGTGDTVVATSNYLTLYIDENILVENADSTEISTSLYSQLVRSVQATNDKIDAIESGGASSSQIDAAVKAQIDQYIADGTISGVSPRAYTTQTEDGAILTVTDKDGTTSSTIFNGKDGADGADGKDGGYYTPTFRQSGDKLVIGYSVSDSTLPSVEDSVITLPAGSQGEDGISPSVNVAETESGAVITISDKDGTTTATLSHGKKGDPGEDGKDGSDGKDGVSPTVSISKLGKSTTLTITDVSGTHTAEILDGSDGNDGVDGGYYTPAITQQDDQMLIAFTPSNTMMPAIDSSTISLPHGANGADGFSPVASVVQTDTGAIFTVTDKSGTTTANISNGDDGVGIASVEQTKTSEDDNGVNELTVTLSDGASNAFVVRNGSQGSAGFSPVVTVENTVNGHEVTITDINGSQTFEVLNGTAGDGSGDMQTAIYDNDADGVVERADVADQALSLSSEATITSEQISDFEDAVIAIAGNGGNAAVSPTITQESIDGGTRLTITDINGKQTVDILNGSDGADGADGLNGENGKDGGYYTPSVSQQDDKLIVDYTASDAAMPAVESVSITLPSGADGSDGADGFSPTAKVSETEDGVAIEITDKDGTTSAAVKHGEKGDPGADGVGILSIEQTTQPDDDNGDNVISIALSDGVTKEFVIKNGSKGEDGADGVSPQVSVSKSGKITTLTITDASGTHTAEILDGAEGSGTGDMLSSVYDPDQDGIVEFADQAKSLASDATVSASQVTDFADAVREIVGDVNTSGVSPTIAVSDIEGGHRLTITDINGEKTVDVMNGTDGVPGANGADGYTPVRGTDYWTDDDIAEIKSYVDDAILNGKW